MTDGPNDPTPPAIIDGEASGPVPDALEARLERHFVAQVHRAERDIGRGWLGRPVPAPTVPARGARLAPIGALVVGAVVLVGSVLGLQALPVQAPGSTPIPPGSSGLGEATASASPSVAPSGPTHPGGIPSILEGQTVVRPAEAAALLAARTDNTPLLVGGWFLTQALPCPYTPPRYVPPAPFLTCNGNALWSRPVDPTSVTMGPNSVYALAVTPDTAPIPQGAVVVQVHTNDPRAAACSTDLRSDCRAAVIVDRVLWPTATPTDHDIGSRFPDGIPSQIDGATVLRPADALARAQTATDDTPFLVGGWRGGYIVMSCMPQIQPHVEATLNPLFDPCSGYVVRDGPGANRAAIKLPALGNLPNAPGPIVVRVHVHDGHADECGVCEQAFVLDAIVWTGDGETETTPLTIDDVVRRLARADPDLTVSPFSSGERTGCNPGWPPQSWRAERVSNDPSIARILVFPDPIAAAETRQRLLADGIMGRPSPPATSRCSVLYDGLMSSAWLLQDNVIVEVRVPVGTTPAFIDTVRHDLATEP